MKELTLRDNNPTETDKTGLQPWTAVSFLLELVSTVYFPAICSTCLSPSTPELDQFRLGWPKNQFPDVRSGAKSRSRSLFTKTLPGSPPSSPRASRSVFVLLCWSFGSLDPFLERKPRKLLFPSNETKPRINRMRQPLSCRCRVRFSKQSDQPCRNLSHLYFG